jgi:organic radical activating enzyme
VAETEVIVTKECPLRCPGCCAYGETHLGRGATLRNLSDFRGGALVDGVLGLVRRHKPTHVSLVGGKPLIRHRELCRILPALSEMGVFTLVSPGSFANVDWPIHRTYPTLFVPATAVTTDLQRTLGVRCLEIQRSPR